MFLVFACRILGIMSKLLLPWQVFRFLLSFPIHVNLAAELYTWYDNNWWKVRLFHPVVVSFEDEIASGYELIYSPS